MVWVAFSSSLVCQSPAVWTGPGTEVHRCSPQAGSLIQVDQDLRTCAQLPVMDPPNLATINGLIRGIHIDRCLGVERDWCCVYCVSGCKLRWTGLCFFEDLKCFISNVPQTIPKWDAFKHLQSPCERYKLYDRLISVAFTQAPLDHRKWLKHFTLIGLL